jgi:hypothetical protein
MKKILIILCVSLGYMSVNAQSYDGKGDSKFNIGYEAYGYGNGIKATYDYGLGELFSIGAGASAYFNDDENDYFIYARTQVHLGIAFDMSCKFDIYPGVELGYLSSEKVGIAGYIGIRYFITKKMGLFAEIGNNGSVGLSFNV